VPGSNLECTFELSPGVIQVRVTVRSLDGEPPSTDTFAWTVLTALADEVSSSVTADSRVTIGLRKWRGVPESDGHTPTATPVTPQPTKTQWADDKNTSNSGPVGTP
jgi:serine/threonine-protein kinase RsbW